MTATTKVFLTFLIVALGIQLIHPSRTNPPVDPARTIEVAGHMPPDVAAIVARSCKDCHSYETKWPWYSGVAPASWLTWWDVKEGRRHVSMSTWADYDARTKAKKLDDICENIQNGEMPEGAYLLVHSEAELTDKDKQAVCAWAKQEVGPK